MKRLMLVLAMVVFLMVGWSGIGNAWIVPKFQEYKWGGSRDEVKEIIASKGHRITLQTPTGFGYADRILGKKVMVYFYFTPKTKKLATVGLVWKTTSVGSSLLRILVEKYGGFNRPNQFMEKYVWWYGGVVLLHLDFDFMETVLFYYSREYMPIKMQEKEEMEDKETKGKF